MKTALILSGGGSKGAIEIGACKVVLAKYKPDIIIGTSVGSLNGAMIADGHDMEDNLSRTITFWKKSNRDAFFQFNSEVIFKLAKAQSVFSNKKLYSSMEKMLRARDFEDLHIPLFVNCTNLITGEPRYFHEGPILDPLIASCSAVPLLPPVIIDDVPYIDGLFGSIFGVGKAIEQKCRRIILIDVERVHPRESFSSMKEYFEYSWGLLKNQNIRKELELCRSRCSELIEISPSLTTLDMLPTDFSNVDELIKAGEEAASKVLDKKK
jgi:NTE family protein